MIAEAISPLFQYPQQAAFDRILPKNKIYAHAKPSRRLQQRFTEDVAQIVWKYKLAPETIRLPARSDIEEIQVFAVTLKEPAEDDLTEDVLRCIDRAIRFPIIFEVIAPERLRVVAAYKRSSEADSAKWVVGDYFMSAWFPKDAPRVPLPVALDLAALYTHILRRLMPHPPRDGETLQAHADRLAAIDSLENEHRTLETQLNREKQFNRKVEINAQLRAVRTQINSLTSSTRDTE
jgi:Domain of unknown function (DUF4391)